MLTVTGCLVLGALRHSALRLGAPWGSQTLMAGVHPRVSDSLVPQRAWYWDTERLCGHRLGNLLWSRAPALLGVSVWGK